ncbi:PREDICTED: sentrin-specific protease 1-like isoform X1 [Papilio xuthus]|uniref:Sentrin-specific protease 1-like isoform X1 n=1 Tax=Papilio xuthus TaxID=66420 RepID=A0AAJ7EIM0_PAPXU|nr:PREDICTED: sentrin-specific protease 1-like isoform X1 [Papilio xuthus]
MKSVVAYVRSLLGWCDSEQSLRTNLKRDRADDESSSDDDLPSLKRFRQLRKTNFPDVMSTNDLSEIKTVKPAKNVRYVPIQIESGHPSTSTPNVLPVRTPTRLRLVSDIVGDVNKNGSTYLLKSKVRSPVRQVVQAVVDDSDEDEEPKVSWVESKPDTKKTVYINLDEDEIEKEDDVILVREVSPPQPAKQYKYVLSNNEELGSKSNKQYYRLTKIKDKEEKTSPRIHSLKTHGGISKSYKKVTPLPNWMQKQNLNLSPKRNRVSNLNGNGRTMLSEVFNLHEKRNYQELIRRVATSTTPLTFSKPVDIINLAEETASFRNTLKSQKRSLNELKLLEKDLSINKENQDAEEYDPVTVASLNLSDSDVEVVPSECSTTSSTKITPVNSLRDSLNDKDITAKDWLPKLHDKYKKKKEYTNKKIENARRESDIISKVNHEQSIALIANKFKYELSLPESLIEEVPATPDFPKLSPEQEQLIKRALGPGPLDQVFVQKFRMSIRRRDLQTLSGLNWLNDEVINFYMELITQRSEQRPDLPKVHHFNTFFYPKLMRQGQAALQRWTKKVDIFSKDIILVPVHLGVHWCMSIVDLRAKHISYLDSMGGSNQPCLDALLQYLRDEHQDKKGQPFDDKDWKTENLKNIPQQMNGSDCGMFACTFAEFACRDEPYSFTQAHMPYLRRKAALEILRAELLL